MYETVLPFTGKSGNPYRLKFVASIQMIANTHGVYLMAIWPRTPFGGVMPLYWGKAEKQGMADRLATHERLEEAIGRGCNCYAFYEAEPKLCYEIEKDLIHGNPTPMNVQHNALMGDILGFPKQPTNALMPGTTAPTVAINALAGFDHKKGI